MNDPTTTRIDISEDMLRFLMSLCIGEGIEYGRFESERKLKEPIPEFKERRVSNLLEAAMIIRKE